MLRIGEVAKALGVSIDTLRRWEADGRVKFVRRGNQRMLPATQLPKLLRSQTGANQQVQCPQPDDRRRGLRRP